MTNQPKIIKVDDKIRLRAYDGNYMLAVPGTKTKLFIIILKVSLIRGNS